MDARRQKAHELADRARIVFKNGYYLVPSQTSGTTYAVDLDEHPAACTCPDFELRDKDCKHIMAARLFAQRQARGVEQDAANTDPAPKVPRPTYVQAWPQYNAAQVNEQRHLQELLADLCRGVAEPPRKPGRGRKPVPLADQAFAAVLKVYSLFSARRFMGDIENAVERGYIARGMHFNSVLKAFDNEALTPVLVDMIRRSSLPLRTVETVFAPDSTGFCTSRFVRWFDVKWGVTRQEAEWVKVHLMTGVKTNIVTAAEIHAKDANDSPILPSLTETTAQGFRIDEMSADAAYAALSNFDAVAAHGGTLYAAFKMNTTGAVGGLFEKMFHTFCLNREAYLQHYHRRSNVESTVSMVKRKFGDSVRSKTDTAMRNEVFCKLVCHNLCCLIAAMYELGITPTFCEGDEDDGPRDVLPFRPSAG